jgi:hypothetical protein
MPTSRSADRDRGASDLQSERQLITVYPREDHLRIPAAFVIRRAPEPFQR